MSVRSRKPAARSAAGCQAEIQINKTAGQYVIIDKSLYVKFSAYQNILWDERNLSVLR